MADARENLQEGHETESRSVKETKGKEDEDVIESPRSITSNPSSHQSRVSSRMFPIRPGKEDCKFYLENGWCRHGDNCRYNHPEARTIPDSREQDVQENPQEQRQANIDERQGKEAQENLQLHKLEEHLKFRSREMVCDKSQGPSFPVVESLRDDTPTETAKNVGPYRDTYKWGPSRADEVEHWGKPRQRPSLVMKPRSGKIDSGGSEAPPGATKTNKPNPFGEARPREYVLAERVLNREIQSNRYKIQKDAALFSDANPQELLLRKKLEKESILDKEKDYATSGLTRQEILRRPTGPRQPGHLGGGYGCRYGGRLGHMSRDRDHYDGTWGGGGGRRPYGWGHECDRRSTRITVGGVQKEERHRSEKIDPGGSEAPPDATKTSKLNPFGEARPREYVLAERALNLEIQPNRHAILEDAAPFCDANPKSY